MYYLLIQLYHVFAPANFAYFWYCRLEQEEQARQKLQLEKVTADTKLKKFEEELAQHETVSAKVCFLFDTMIFVFMATVSFC